MRRVLVTTESTAYGGVERRLLDEIHVLRELGYAVDVAPRAFPGSERWLAEVRLAGAGIIYWPVYKFLERGHWCFPAPQTAWLSRLSLLGRSYAFAHVAMPWTTAGLSRMVALKRAGIPVVLGLHIECGPARIHPRLKALANEALAAVMAGYGVSRVVVDSFIRAYPDLQVASGFSVIWNGVDETRFKPDPEARRHLRAEWGWSERERVLTVCGRLDPSKNLDLVFAAFEEAATQASDLRLLVIGDGPERRKLEQRSAELKKRVRFVGHVSDVPKYLAAADVYVSASLLEGFPLAAGEAVATGLEVLAIDTAVYREAYGQCPSVRLISRGEPKTWVDAMLSHSGFIDTAAGRRNAMNVATAKEMRHQLRRFYEVLGNR